MIFEITLEHLLYGLGFVAAYGIGAMRRAMKPPSATDKKIEVYAKTLQNPEVISSYIDPETRAILESGVIEGQVDRVEYYDHQNVLGKYYVINDIGRHWYTSQFKEATK